MLSERSIVKVRWLTLASTLAFFAIIDVKQMRGLLVLVAIGVMYNLLLSSVKTKKRAEQLRGISIVIDLAGLGLLIYYTGGMDSIFVIFLAIYIFSVAIRAGVGAGVVVGLMAAAASSYYYFSDPTLANQTLVLTRAIVFAVAPLGALMLDHGHGHGEKVDSEPAVAAEHVSIAVIEPEPMTVAKIEVKTEPTAEVAHAPDPAPITEAAHAPEPAPITEVAPAPEPAPIVDPAPVIEARVSEIDITPRSLADELAIKVDRQDHHEELKFDDAHSLRQKITELAILHEASKALGATLVLGEVVDTIVDIAAKGMVADIAGALIIDDTTGLMTVAGLRGFSSEEREVINSTTFVPGENILGESFSKKTTYNVEDLSEERPGWSPFNGRIRSFLVTPLATEGYKIGVLFLGRYVREPFTESSEGFLETMAGQAAIAVENAKLYSQAQELAIHDGLTGTYNYRHFMKQLEEEIKRAERYGRSVSLAMIDIDLFKNVNDTYGHQRGDDVLRGLTQTLTSNTRETDIVARYGGEEFVVILPETDIADALDVAEKLRTSVAKANYARENGQSIKITISLGVATYPSIAGNQEELLRRADDALYSAKTKRNMVVSAGSENRSLS